MHLNTQLLSQAFKLTAPWSCTFSEVSTDTRSLLDHAIFIAIKGEKFDGHTYIPTALQKGAKAILAESYDPQLVKQHPEVWFIKVDSTLDAIRTLAKLYRSQMNFPILAVGGSVGKTTTKELLTSVLKSRYTHVHTTKGSENGYLGIALTVLRTPPKTEFSVIEVGIDEPGAMIQHVELLRPTHSVLTAIGPEHLEKLINLETVTREECLLLEKTLDHQGTVYLNLLDPILRSQSFKNSSKLILTRDPKYSYRYPLPGEHNIQNAKLTACIAEHLGLSQIQIQEGFDTFIPAFGRTEIIELTPALTVICDYYNANPSSMKASLLMAYELALKQKRSLYCALADMKELGSDEKSYHEALAEILTPLHPSGIYLHGERMKWLKEKLQSPQVHYSNDLEALSLELAETLKSLNQAVILLIKGSRSMKMERVFECLKHKF